MSRKSTHFDRPAGSDDEDSTNLSISGISDPSNPDQSFQVSEISKLSGRNSPISSLNTSVSQIDADFEDEGAILRRAGGVSFKRNDTNSTADAQNSNKDDLTQMLEVNSGFNYLGGHGNMITENLYKINSRLKRRLKKKEEELSQLQKKYKKVKGEYFKLKDKNKEGKEKIQSLKQRLRKEADLEQDHKETLVMVINKLKDGLGKEHVSKSVSSKNLTLTLGEVTGEVNQRLRKLKQLENQPKTNKPSSSRQTSRPNQTHQNRPAPQPQTRPRQQTRPQAPRNQFPRGNTSTPSGPSLKELKLKVQVVKSFWQSHLVGEFWTLLAMKNESNFLIGTHQKGIILVKNGQEVYVENLPEKGERLWDMVYASGQDCYFMCHNGKLYKKTNDQLPPTLVATLEFGFRVGACMKYSPKKDKLIVNAGGTKLSVLNPSTGRVDMVMPSCHDDGIRDFELFGSNENKVVYITMEGYVAVAKYSESNKQGSTILKHDIPLKEDRNEKGLSIRVCSKNKIVCAGLARELKDPIANLNDLIGGLIGGIGDLGGLGGIGGVPGLPGISKPITKPVMSRYMVFEINHSGLIVRACLDCYHQEIGRVHGLGFFDYIGDRALFVGLGSDQGKVHILEYNTRSGQLKELEQYRVSCCEHDPVHILKFGNKFYYTGRNSNLVKLTILKNGLFM